MSTYYWNDWYAGWGWFLWFGVWFLLLSSFGNWGYTYQAHRRYRLAGDKNAMEILSERYAKGEIQRDEYLKMKEEIRNDLSETKKPKARHSGSSVRMDAPIKGT